MRDSFELRCQVDLEVFFLPNWCRLHDSSNSEFTCELCQEAIEQVKEQVEQQNALLPIAASRIELDDQELQPSDNLVEGNPHKDVERTTVEEWHNPEPPNNET